MQMVFLHILPGAVQMTAYVVLAPFFLRAGMPGSLAFLAVAVLAGLPCMLVVLLRARRRMGQGSGTWREVVRNRQPMPMWQYAVLYPSLLALAFGVLFATMPLNRLLAEQVFSWLPDYIRPGGQPPVSPDRTLVLLGLVLQVVIDGIAAPVTEEVYFRGYLLPRMGYLGRLAPAVNALLFTVQHFWQPQNWVLIYLLSMPLAYVVWWKRNIYIAMLVHGSANTIGAVMGLVEFFTS
jgi:membrane protease YdiL (CAAX protease family)